MILKKNGFRIISLSVIAFVVVAFIYKLNKKNRNSNEQLVLSEILKRDKNSISASPWGAAYKKGDLTPLIQALKDENPKNIENFFQFSVHYFDVKEPVNLSPADLQILITETFHFLEKNQSLKNTARSRTLLFPFIKRLRGLGQDDLLREKLLNWTKKWTPKEPHFIDSLDVLVGIVPFDEELLATSIKVLRTAPDHETFEISQILQELKDPHAKNIFLVAIAGLFDKASALQQPLYFKILIQSSSKEDSGQGQLHNLDLDPKIQFALKQSSDLWVDAILTSATFAKEPQVFRPFIQKIAQDASRPLFKHRADDLLKIIK